MRPSHRVLAIGFIALALPGTAWADDAPATPPKGLHPTAHTEITPYIEADQVLTADISPDNDAVTYTSLAAGVDATVVGRNSAASASVRYERHFDEGGHGSDSDTVSGVVRASVALVPHTLTIEGGALASRESFDSSGAAFSTSSNVVMPLATLTAPETRNGRMPPL